MTRLCASIICAAFLTGCLLADTAERSITIIEGFGPEFTDVSKPNVVIPITFAEKSGRKTQLFLVPSPLANASASVETHVFNETGAVSSITVPPWGTARVYLTAFLPDAGKYRCIMRILSGVGKGRLPLPDLVISITRTRTQPSVDVPTPPARQLEIGWGGTAIAAEFDLQIYATGGDTRLPAPVLVNALRKEKADSAVGTSTTVRLQRDPNDLTIVSGAAVPLRLSLAEITAPGRYDATVRFAPAGYQPIDTLLTAYVREPWYHAFLLIFLGVLASFLVHAYTATIRPRLVTQQRVIAWHSQISETLQNAAGNADEVSLVSALDERIRTKWEDARKSRRPIGTSLDIYDQIIPALQQWVTMHRYLLGVKPVAVREKLLAKLNEARAEFQKDAPDASKVQAAIETLSGMPAEILTEIGTSLKTEVTNLDNQLVSDPRVSAVEIRTMLQLILQKINDKQIDAAVGSFETARLRYVAMLTNDVRSRVAPNVPDPPGFSKADWTKLREAITQKVDEVARQSDVDRAMELLNALISQYLLQVAAGLQRESAHLDNSDRGQVESTLKEMNEALTSWQLTTAWRKLQEAQKKFDDAMTAQTGQKLGMEPAVAAATAGSNFDPIGGFDLPASWAFLGSRVAASFTRTAITTSDILTSVLVLVVAGAIGVQTLWVDNQTWGGGVAYLAAFIWGFASDQFTHAGVMALLKR